VWEDVRFVGCDYLRDLPLLILQNSKRTFQRRAARRPAGKTRSGSLEAHGFDETTTLWLTLLLQSDPTLPAPTAGAMVARVRQLPIGADLAAACSSDRT
jgi:hypothetical protein